MKQIRHSIFETNSSSSHSFTFSSTTNEETWEKLKRGDILIEPGQYDVQHIELNKAIDKLAYLYLIAYEYEVMLSDIFDKYIEKLESEFNTKIEFKADGWSWIDHGDDYVSELKDNVFISYENFRRFVLDPTNIIYLGGSH